MMSTAVDVAVIAVIVVVVGGDGTRGTRGIVFVLFGGYIELIARGRQRRVR